MSLFKQLLLIISVLFLVIFSVNFAMSVNHIRYYLQGEAEIHVQDTATSLGLSLSPYLQNTTDPMIKSRVSAIFDRGYYQQIKLVDIEGEVLVNLAETRETQDVPGWFIDFLPMRTATAMSEISTGWNIAGTLYVTAHSEYAYLTLYQQAKSTFYYSLVAWGLSSLLLFFVLHVTLRSLRQIEQMALNITQGQFDVIESLPWTTEVKNVTTAMNQMSRKLESSLSRLNIKLAKIDAKIHQDDVTGFKKKNSFDTDMKTFFIEAKNAYLFMIKLDSLSCMVKEKEGDSIDLFLRVFSQTLKEVCNQQGVSTETMYRFFGAEFVILLKNVEEEKVKQLAEALSFSFDRLGRDYGKADLAHMGIIVIDLMSTTENMLASAHEAYEQAQMIGMNRYFIKAQTNLSKGIDSWKNLVFNTIDQKNFTVAYVNQMMSLPSQTLMMEDVFLLVHDEAGQKVSTGTFISIAEKFTKIVDLDKAVLAQVMEHILFNKIDYIIAVSLSTRTVKNSDFRHWLEEQLQSNPMLAKQLVFSFSAYAVSKDVAIFKDFIHFAHQLKAKAMIRRYENHSMSTETMKVLKPDYIRLAREIGNGIAMNSDKQLFVTTLHEMGALLDIHLLAEGVEGALDFSTLQGLEIDGVSR